MLAGCPDPRVDQGIANRFRYRIEAPLLGRFVRMVKVKFVDKFIQRHRKIGDVLAADASDLGKVLRARHQSIPYLFADLAWIATARSLIRSSAAGESSWPTKNLRKTP